MGSRKQKIRNFLFFSILLPILGGCGQEEKKEVIHTRADLVVAISQANNGDTIYVGDIDFSVKPGLHRTLETVTIDKDITIKGANKNKSIFTHGSFNIEGTKVTGKKNIVSFSNISFDGGVKTANITQEKWTPNNPEDDLPRFMQYASMLSGNLEVNYDRCDFADYAYTRGGAICGMYGDYSFIPSMMDIYGDNKSCSVLVNINKCSFEGNNSYYNGGAIAFEGYKKNANLKINDSTFKNNNSACMDFCLGGGACAFNDCDTSINGCTFRENNGSYSYGKTLLDTADTTNVPPEFIDDYLSSLMDQTSGGALLINGGLSRITDTIFVDNKASLGGGVSGLTSELSIDGCSFSGNSATCDLLNDIPTARGPWSNMGLGGGLYLNSAYGIKATIWNTTFFNNIAKNGYGAFYSYYNDVSSDLFGIYPDLDFNFCSFKDNLTINEYDVSLEPLWAARPGNPYEIPYIDFSCCAINDVSNYSFNKYELPSQNNKYCYYTDNTHSLNDNVEFHFDGAQINLKSNSYVSLEVPETFTNQIVGDRYGSKSKGFIIGTNYSKSLYEQLDSPKKSSSTTWIIILASTVVAIATAIAVVFIVKSKKSKEVKEETGNTTINIEETIARIKNDVKISNREEDVLRLILSGAKRNEMANTLFLSESAIKKYTSNLYRKLNVHSKVELIIKYQNNNEQ